MSIKSIIEQAADKLEFDRSKQSQEIEEQTNYIINNFEEIEEHLSKLEWEDQKEVFEKVLAYKFSPIYPSTWNVYLVQKDIQALKELAITSTPDTWDDIPYKCFSSAEITEILRDKFKRQVLKNYLEDNNFSDPHKELKDKFHITYSGDVLEDVWDIIWEY